MKIFSLHYAIVCSLYPRASLCAWASERMCLVPFAFCLHISSAIRHCCWLLFLRPFTALNISKLAYAYASKLFVDSRRRRLSSPRRNTWFVVFVDEQRTEIFTFNFRSEVMLIHTFGWMLRGKTWEIALLKIACHVVCSFKFSLLSFVRHVIWQLLKICTKML